MSDKIGDTFFIEEEPEQQCDLCGKIAELRPYGPNGECICFECGRTLWRSIMSVHGSIE